MMTWFRQEWLTPTSEDAEHTAAIAGSAGARGRLLVLKMINK
jgi:hypothetical protein